MCKKDYGKNRAKDIKGIFLCSKSDGRCEDVYHGVGGRGAEGGGRNGGGGIDQ